MDFVKHFDLLFGGIFATLGMIAMIVGAVLGVVFIRRPPGDRTMWLSAIVPFGIGAIFAAIGVIWVGSSVSQLQREEHLRTYGVTVRATVVDVEQTGSQINGRYLWQIRYEYQDSRGRYYEGVSRYMERIEAQRFQIGEQAYIRYDPADPSVSMWLGREDIAALRDTMAVIWYGGPPQHAVAVRRRPSTQT